MIPSFVRWAPRLVACAALFSAASTYGQVQAVQVLVQGSGTVCSSWSVGGSAQQPTLTCNTGAAPALTCGAASANPSTIAPGGSSTVSVTCTGGTGAISYSLNGGAPQASNQFTVTPTLTTAYTVKAADAVGGSVQKQTSVTVSTGGGAGGGGPVSCSGVGNGNGISGTQNLNLTKTLSSPISAGVNDVIVVQFTATSTSHPGTIRGFEYGSAPAKRVAVLSATPCDFSGALPYSTSGPSTSVSASMAVSPVKGGGSTFLVPLVAGQTYYWNILTLSNETCGGNCGMKVTLSP